MINRENYLFIKEYLTFLEEDKHRSPETIGRYWSWFHHLLVWADETSFARVHTVNPSFAKYVDNLKPTLALESQKKLIETARAFFEWAKMCHSKKFEKLPPYWIFKLTPPKVNLDNPVIEFVSLDEARTLASAPVDPENMALLRDRAAAAMLFLSGARAHAFTTLPIQAVHLDEEFPYISQWPELGVCTKNGKRANTFLLNIPELLTVVRDWDQFVRSNCQPDYPWYAPIDQQWGRQGLSHQTPGANRNHSLNRRMHLLYQAASLPYQSPHKFRHGYATYGLGHCRNMLEYKSLSINLMHASTAITDRYSHVEEQNRAVILASLVNNPVNQPDDELRTYLESLSKADLKRSMVYAIDLLSR